MLDPIKKILNQNMSQQVIGGNKIFDIEAQPIAFKGLLTSDDIAINHLGYELNQHKSAILCVHNIAEQDSANLVCNIRNIATDKLYSFEVGNAQNISGWGTQRYYNIDFSAMNIAGNYRVEVVNETGLSIVSEVFAIDENIYTNTLFPMIIEYFKSQRCAGEYEEKDKSIGFVGGNDSVKTDVSGGWYDASGDVSKYLSHLSYANYMNPQQTPLVVFALAEATGSTKISQELSGEYLQETIWGADFLVKMCNSDGIFYQTLFDVWTGDVEQREICEYSTQLGHKHDTWEAAFRQGAGMSIAALAKFSINDGLPIAKQTLYLDVAKRAFDHLIKNNEKYLNDGVENIIDDYCALYAANALYLATDLTEYKDYAAKYALKLIDRLKTDKVGNIFWFMDDDKQRVFNHAADEGMPVLALIDYIVFANEKEKPKILSAINMAIQSIVNKTVTDVNPFNYPKHIIGIDDNKIETQFFFPHNNESGYWWQGENARLGSLICALNKARPFLDDDLLDEVDVLSASWCNWILGQNPFHTCMMQGVGRNIGQYYSAKFPNTSGGICNGITSSLENEAGIAFCETEDLLQSWRWSEQWIPHSAWLLMALCSMPKFTQPEENRNS